MIAAEQKANIRRLFHGEHWKIGTIAAELGLHPDTVRAALEIERFKRGPAPRAALTARRCACAACDPRAARGRVEMARTEDKER